MTRKEVLAFNSGVAALAEIAAASADALRTRITEAPTRFNFAIGALDGIVDAAAELLLPSADTKPSTVSAPRPLAPTVEALAHFSEAEVVHG